MKFGLFRTLKSAFSKNTCKTCALGMGGQKGGMRNEVGRFPEVCKKSIQAMQSDLQKSIPQNFYTKNSIEKMSKLGSRKLDSLGRIANPLYAKKGDSHFKVISWPDAYLKICQKLKATDPQKSFFYFSGRSSNEAGFLLQIMARVYGTNHINNCSYYCHQASGVGLTDSLGSGTATVNLKDIESCDLFFLIGGNPSSNHPRLMTTLMHLRRKKAKVVVINPVIEPGLKNFRIPSDLRSMLFGTKIADFYIQPHIGGDQALLCGIAKFVIQKNAVDENFVTQSSENFDAFKASVESLSWEEIEDISGITRTKIEEIADLYIRSKRTVFAWTMGITHHLNGVENVQSIVNLALLRGMVGKDSAGLLPLRGHSNVQGMGTMGVTPNLKKKVFENLTSLGFRLPELKGLDTMGCMDAANEGKMDFAWLLGGNLYASNPDLKFAAQALSNIGMIVHLNTTFNQGHVSALGEENIILPVLARDEESQSTTQESMFSYLRLSSGGKKRVSLASAESEIIATVAANLFGNSPINWCEMRSHNNIRSLIAKCIPGLEKIENIDQTKKEFTIPNRIFHNPKFPTSSTKAKFAVHPIVSHKNNQPLTMMSVRSEGQYNTVVFEDNDSYRGIDSRNVILLNKKDLAKFNLIENQKVTVKSSTGSLTNIKVKEFEIKAGNALMYYPESNELIPRTVDPRSKTPAFKSVAITIER